MELKEMDPIHIYLCGKCKEAPVEPVVTECGHFFCWSCLYKHVAKAEGCPVCESLVNLNRCYPIFIQNHLAEDSVGCPRPAAVYRDKIINPGIANSSMPVGLSNLPNNIECRKRVPGGSYIPSMSANFFNRIAEPKQGDQDAHIYACCRKVSIALGLGLLTQAVFILFL